MKNEKKRPVKTYIYKTEGATIIIHRPEVTEEERERILERIAEIKATW